MPYRENYNNLLHTVLIFILFYNVDKEKQIKNIPLTNGKGVIVAAIGMVVFWILDSLMEFFVFKVGTLGECFFVTSPQHLWIRLSPGFLFGGIFFFFKSKINTSLAEQQKLIEEWILSENVFQSTLEGIAITDGNNRITRVNPGFSEITGYSSKEVLGKNPRILKSGQHPHSFYVNMWAELDKNGQWSGEIWNRRKNGETYLELLSIKSIKDSRGKLTNHVAIFHDISELKMKEEELLQVSYHDSLTGLPNRVLLLDRFHMAVSRAERDKKIFALCYLDVDNFKDVNNTLGHSLGDQFLVKIKDRIAHVCREGDTLARYSGDEFVLLLSELNSEQEGIKIIQRVMKLFVEPIYLNEHETFTGISVGITYYPNDGKDLNTLVKNANLALDKVKKKGKKGYQLYVDSFNQEITEKAYIERSMRKAIKQSSFELYYQPKVDLKRGTICGAEALIRWKDEVKGWVSPGVFIPIAENTGMILEIGEWVLYEACRQLCIWQAEGVKDLSIAVNLSARQFGDRRLIDLIDKVLCETGLDGSHLNLEVTEYIAMKNVDRTIEVMKKLSLRGIGFSIDDFGTGYSSLGYLKRFPLNELKIDKSFIDEVPFNSSDVAISRAIISMAKSLDYRVVAEGVETSDQLNFLIENGCDIIQGYLFSKPLPGGDFLNLLNEKKDFLNSLKIK